MDVESAYSRYLAGDDGAAGEIIRRYRDGLTLFINGFVCDINAAEELCENAFVKLLVKKPRFRGRSSLKTYIYSIGKNEALDYLRRKKRRAEESLDNCAELLENLETPETAFFKKEQKAAVHKALSRLKPQYSRIIFLIYFEDFSAKEAAVVMNKTVRAAEVMLSRARAALKDELEREGFIYENL